ncbi:hypothetical protein IFM89_038250 [Coptis chinensis]|uniref:Glycosyltransferase n=1 Tax=Coptis chinensis TaxID=261450 RepID=A0A835HWZ6_9MAGN|nr:hypothetical protein IFM89_038250 [Coptis chinensis]
MRGKIKRQEGSDNEDDVVQGQAKGDAKGKGKKYIGRNGKRRRQEGNDNEDDVDKGQAEVEGSRNNLENLKVDSEFATSIEEAIELFDEYYIPDVFSLHRGANVNDKIILNKVLLVWTKTTTYIGQPVVTNAAVHTVVEDQGLDPKGIVYKYKNRKNYRRNIGHRQKWKERRETGMEVMKSFKVSKTFSVFTLVFLACLLFYLSSNLVDNIGKSRHWTTQYRDQANDVHLVCKSVPSISMASTIFIPLRIKYVCVQKKKMMCWHLQRLEREELGRVLKKASMDDRTIILTTLNKAWAKPGSVFDLFLESFRIGEGTSRLLNHLVIVAVDPTAFTRCKSIHPHCFNLTTPGVDFAEDERFMSENYLKLMWRRIDFLRIVLELGYNFVFTDADIMWFRDPFPYFDSMDEIHIACDIYKGNPSYKGNLANGGFTYVKSVGATIEFYKYWYMARLLHDKQHDQQVFEIIKLEPVVAALGLRIRYLDTKYFGGFCQPSKDMNKVCTMHANCCVGIENKIPDLKNILNDWKNFTSLSQQEKEAKGSSTSASPWSAPNKCKPFLPKSTQNRA